LLVNYVHGIIFSNKHGPLGGGYNVKSLAELRHEIDTINTGLLNLLNRRAETVLQIYQIRKKLGVHLFVPERESEMLKSITETNQGPFSDFTIKSLFKEIFRASLNLMEEEARQVLLSSRQHRSENTVVEVGPVEIGGPNPVIMAGPCAVESWNQMESIAAWLSGLGVQVMRGGAFKPRTSPYAFQGLEEKGLRYLQEAGQRYGLVTITEVVDPRHLDLLVEQAGILQIGARNMANFELLKAVGQVKKPVMLKRGFMATMEEYLYAVEYILSGGNTEVILCERGIRTFERWTRNTLDISAVPILKQETHLPVIVDISHSTGRKDIAVPLARAALAAGADGIMVEVHNDPEIARSDEKQQLGLKEFADFIDALKPLL